MKQLAKLFPPPFPIGAKVEYVGNRSMWDDASGTKPLLTKGMVFEITEHREPEKGFGFIKNDEDGEPIISHDKDGCSVYVNARGDKKLIHAKDKTEWKISE